MTAATAMAAGLLLTPGLAEAAGAAASGPTTVFATPDDTTNPTCSKGYANAYEFYTLCKGTSPASYRTIAYCADGDVVLGVEYADSSGSLSYADCSSTDGLDSTLSADWGVLMCSNYNGSGTFQGYVDTSGDISWIMLNWGAGSIPTGATTLCDYSIGQATAINPNTPPT